MKRLSTTDRERSKRKALRGVRRSAREIARRRAAHFRMISARAAFQERRRGLPLPRIQPGSLLRASNAPEVANDMMAPAVLSLGDNYDEVLGFLYEYRWQLFAKNRQQRKALSVSLAEVREIGLDAALVLTAEYHRLWLRRPTRERPFINDLDWPEGIRAVMSALGLYDLVQASGRSSSDEIDLSAAPYRFVPFHSGKMVDGKNAVSLIDSLTAAAGSAPRRIQIYNSLIEAMKNVRNHAYPEGRPPQIEPRVERWWAAGAYDPASHTLAFAVYDQGVGIPSTLPRQTFAESIFALCPPERTDADIIAGGIEFGRTSTGLAHRGNGLWTICEVAKALPSSQVRILSGRGEVTYSADGSVRKSSVKNAFCGTLIQWNLHMPPSLGGH